MMMDGYEDIEDRERRERPFAVPEEAPAPPLDFLSAASIMSDSKPHREFLIPGIDLFPVRNVHGLYGDGGTGKSLLLVQLGVAMASATSWLGYMPTPGAVLYYSAEDDRDETEIRLHDICEGEGIGRSDLAGLRIAFMAGRDAILAHEDAKGTGMKATPLMSRLRAAVEQHRPRLVILDNLADIFAGNENARPLARQFVGMLRAIAIECDTTIIIAAHPSLSGMASGTGASGNTAWNNSVRSRMFLKRQHDKLDEITDPDIRRLVTMKANYGAIGGEIGMRWDRGRFVPTASVGAGSLDRLAANAKAERVFLSLVQRFADEGRHVSPSRSATFGPTVFAAHPHSEGVTKLQLERAMNLLLEDGRVKIEQVGPKSKRRSILVPGGK